MKNPLPPSLIAPPLPVPAVPPLHGRVGWMSFVNTLPMRHGVETLMPVEFQPVYGVPTQLNNALLQGDLDLSLVSTAAYLKHQDAWQLLPVLSISSFGPVHSVLWIRHKDFDPAKHAVQCPDSSASSQALLRYVLNKRYGARALRYETYSHQKSVEDCLKTAKNALLIGDTALRFYAETQAGQHESLDVLDLASAWHELTNLPFLFGVWCARKPFWLEHQAQINDWNDALLEQTRANLSNPQGLFHAYSQQASPPLFSEDLLREYWCIRLDYTFTPSHHDALAMMKRVLC